MSVNGWARVSLAAAVFVSGPAWAQSTTFTPGAGQAMTILFEDLWPAEGDYDFNDVVLSANTRREENVGGQTTEIIYHLGVQAMGASQCAGLALRLPGVSPTDLTITRKIGTAGAADGEPWQSGSLTAVTDGAGGSVINLAGNLRANLCGGAPGFINTVPGSATTTCSPLAVRLEFATPLASPPPEPGDLFIYRCGNTAHQIHGPGDYGVPGGTFAVDKTMYRTFDDLSETDFNGDPLGTTFYVNDAGISWRLELSDEISNFPAENQRIDAVLPGILDFAAGNTSLAWWHTPAGNDFQFQGSPPPFPFTTFYDSVEEGLCDADAFGAWVNEACDCSAGGPFFVWNGATCEESEQARCDADPYGAWSAGACDCGTLSWNGTSCYDATDAQALACANGSWVYSGGWQVGGGGTWANGTCDCTPAGVGYEWMGYGCYDPSGGQEAACVAAGGAWTPWQNGWYWNPYENNYTCDCSSYGPGFYWTGTECTDGSGGTADDCEADGGRWNYGSSMCECRELGYGWFWDGAQCAPSVAEQACAAENGTWTGSICDCPNGDLWTGDPNNLTMGGTCSGGEEDACMYQGGSWTGTNCDCSTNNPGWTWDPELWRCIDPVAAENDCAMAGGWWTGFTCDCSAMGPDYVWDGYQMCNPPDPVVQTCEMEMGTWVPWATFSPTWGGPMPMYGSGTCDCPPGEVWSWNGGMYGSCTPFAEFECWNSGSGMWNGWSCDCGSYWNPSRPYAVWDGETCAPSIEREVCEMTEMSMWDTMANTCSCDSPSCPGCYGWGTWDPIDLECESPERECYRSGGSWDSMYMTCDCNMGGTQYAAWDGQHCVYSGERHACEASGSMWVTQTGMVWDPETQMWNTGPTCDCYNYEGYWGNSYYNGWTWVSDLSWDDQRLECVDQTGRFTCERVLGRMWMTDPMYPDQGYCDCVNMWDPETNTSFNGRWNPTTYECVPDAEVDACIMDGGMWGNDPMMPGMQACYCDTWQHGMGAYWSWDGTTGECTSWEEQTCEASGGSWMGWGSNTCDCTMVGPGYVWGWNPITNVQECYNPTEQACEGSYPGSTWDPVYNSCDCAGSGPYDTWDGGTQCYYNPEKEACVNQGAMWNNDMGSPGYCTCSTGTWQWTGMMNPYDWECVQ